MSPHIKLPKIALGCVIALLPFLGLFFFSNKPEPPLPTPAPSSIHSPFSASPLEPFNTPSTAPPSFSPEPTGNPNSAITQLELSNLLAEIQQQLPTELDLRNQPVEEPRDTSEWLDYAKAYLDQLDEVVQESPQFKTQIMEFLSRCAQNGDILPQVRDLCREKIKIR
ncbi:hypothetical protein WDW37_10725 [Bdellovibrionota bacterium FG-1]